MMENQSSSVNVDSAETVNSVSELSLDQVNLRIGDLVQLQIGNESYFVKLIGYLKYKSFIVSMPEGSENHTRPEMGQPIEVRFSVDNRPFSFHTVISHITVAPFPCLHLAYPNSVQSLQERQYERVRVNITGVANTADDENTACIVHDLSIGGALIALKNPTGVVNDRLLLTLRVEINGTQFELNLDSKIRSVRLGQTSNDTGAYILQGLAFNDLSEKDILALAAFDLFPDWDASN